MKRVVITEVLPGMVLAKPVTNANGLPIIAAGTTLDDTMIDRLKHLELTSAYVEGHAGTATGKTLAELEAELEHRFRRVIRDPLQQNILAALRLHLQQAHGVAGTEGEASTS